MYYLIAVRQYFSIAIMLADQNHAIQLLRSNNIAVYAIYWIIAQPYFKYRKQTEIIDLVQLFLLLYNTQPQ